MIFTVAAFAASSSATVSSSGEPGPVVVSEVPVVDGESDTPSSAVGSSPSSSRLSTTVTAAIPRMSASTPATMPPISRFRPSRRRAIRLSSSTADRIGTNVSSGPATGCPSRSSVRSSNFVVVIRRPLRKVPSLDWFV